jgi:hypothetical protein
MMKRNVCLSAVVAVLLMGTVVWSQSTAAGKRQGTLDKSSDLLRLLRPPSAAPGSKVGMNGSEWMAEPLATAHILQVRHDGLSRCVVVANYRECKRNGDGDIQLWFELGDTAFIYKGGVYSTLTVPGSTGTVAFSVNSLGQIVGEYADNSGAIHGFVDTAGTFTQVDFPGALQTAVTDMNAAGDMVGVWFDSTTSHGFIDKGGVFTSLDFPGATETQAAGSTLPTRWSASSWIPAVWSTGSF